MLYITFFLLVVSEKCDEMRKDASEISSLHRQYFFVRRVPFMVEPEPIRFIGTSERRDGGLPERRCCISKLEGDRYDDFKLWATRMMATFKCKKYAEVVRGKEGEPMDRTSDEISKGPAGELSGRHAETPGEM